MKAVVQRSYGPADVLALQDVAVPVPEDDEVLVRAHAASMHPDVWHVVRGRPYVLRVMGAGVRRPKQAIPGTDVAGVIDAVGPEVTRFRVGDPVFGETVRGIQWKNGAAFAEYVAVREDALARIPEGVEFEVAATVPTSGLIVLANYPSDDALPPEPRVLVNGAAGGVGQIAVQLAKARGATVTGVDHTTKLDVVHRLGADHVLDCTRDDFTTGEERYDLIFDIPGNQPFSRCRRVLTRDGLYVWIGHDGFGAGVGRWMGSLPRALGLMVGSLVVRQLPRPVVPAAPKGDRLAALADLLRDGRLTPFVDRCYPLEHAADALRYLETGRALGRIVVTMPGSPGASGAERQSEEPARTTVEG